MLGALSPDTNVTPGPAKIPQRGETQSHELDEIDVERRREVDGVEFTTLGAGRGGRWLRGFGLPWRLGCAGRLGR